jgi:hypothetical protein
MDTGMPKLSTQQDTLVIANDFWEVIHDPAQGGCPTSVRFFHGSGQNYLAQPLSAHIALNAPEAWATFYRQSACRRATVAVHSDGEALVVSLTGHLANADGHEAPIRYEQSYAYLPHGRVEVSLQLIVEQPLYRSVVEVSPCAMYLNARTDILGIRHSGYAHALPPPPEMAWHEVGRSRTYRDRRAPNCNYTPLYFCAFARGVEGIEFYRGPDALEWDTPFGFEAGGALFRASQQPGQSDFFGAGQDAFYIENLVECDWGDFRTIQPGAYAFHYTLGLPFVQSHLTARRPVYHALVQPRPWPDDSQLQRWAACGVTLLRLHDDNTYVSPSWPDCRYPPYPPEVMREMDRMIATAHRLGMKIVPYFSLKEFHPSCPEYAGNAHVWKRQRSSDPTVIESEHGPYGGYMCMASGWLEFRKASIDLVLRNHAFDGVYYDHTWFRVCRHPAHLGGHPHTDVTQVLDFLHWTRQRVGPDGTVFLHNSSCPSMIGENLADLIFLGEHTDPSAPLPGGFTPDMEFVPIAPRNGIIYGPWPSQTEAVLSHFLEGWPVTAEEDTLPLMQALSRYPLAHYRLYRAGEGPVRTGAPDCYAALYLHEDHALILAANLGTAPARVRLSSPLLMGWVQISVTHLRWGGEAIERAGEHPVVGMTVQVQPGETLLVACRPPIR